jgi:hypothetical protein
LTAWFDFWARELKGERERGEGVSHPTYYHTRIPPHLPHPTYHTPTYHTPTYHTRIPHIHASLVTYRKW